MEQSDYAALNPPLPPHATRFPNVPPSPPIHPNPRAPLLHPPANPHAQALLDRTPPGPRCRHALRRQRSPPTARRPWVTRLPPTAYRLPPTAHGTPANRPPSTAYRPWVTRQPSTDHRPWATRIRQPPAEDPPPRCSSEHRRRVTSPNPVPLHLCTSSNAVICHERCMSGDGGRVPPRRAAAALTTPSDRPGRRRDRSTGGSSCPNPPPLAALPLRLCRPRPVSPHRSNRVLGIVAFPGPTALHRGCAIHPVRPAGCPQGCRGTR